MAETIVLDPAAVATSRTSVDITSFIVADGVDWGDAAIEAYMADTSRGSNPVDYRVPNRVVTIPLVLKTIGATSFDTIRHQLQAKVALFQAEAGWMSRQTSVGTVYADVVSATLKLGGDWLQAYKSVDANAVLTLELLPDWYGAEITLDDMTETTAPELIRVLKLSSSDAIVSGNYQARVRVVVDEDDADTQLGLMWGFRSRYYDSASTAALMYQGGSLTPLDTAGTTTISGAAGTVIRHGTLSTNWTPVLKTTILSGTADLTHRGSYRVWARCYSTSGTTPDVRFLWDVGDLSFPVENPTKTIPGASNFYTIDLGDIRLDPAPVGTHRWQGVIQAKGDSGGENASVDRIWFQPLDDGAGRLAAVIDADPGLATYSARDEFNQTAGVLTGKTASVGGVWAGTGDAADFNVETTGKTAERTVASDADISTGRYEISGVTAFATQAVTVDAKWAGLYISSMARMVMARYVDTSNWLQAGHGSESPEGAALRVVKRVAGTRTVLFSTALAEVVPATGVYYTFRVLVDAAGRWFFWYGLQGGLLRLIAQGQDTDLATGGALATGKPGFYAADTTVNGYTVNFDNFAAWTPALDASLYASRSAQLTTDGMFRQDTSGTAYGPAFHVGDLPRLPVSGLESRKVEVLLKGSRGNLDELPDNGIDDISARVSYRPSWLFVQGS